MNRKLVLAAAAAATLLGATTAAHASNVHWSVGIDLPPVTTVVGNGPGYYPAPVYGAPVYGAPAYYPEPVYYSAPSYSYYPAPVYYAPRVYAPRPRVWVGPAVRPYYGAPWRAPVRRYPHGGYAGHADWRR